MNIFKTQRLTWWQIGILKFSLLSLGITIGVWYSEILTSYVVAFLCIGLVLGLYSALVWFKK